MSRTILSALLFFCVHIVVAQTLTIVSGNNQRQPITNPLNGNPPTAKFEPMSVLLKDASGKAMAGQTIIWAPPANSWLQVSPNADLQRTVTGPDGVAVLKAMGGRSVESYRAGTYTLTARFQGISAEFTCFAEEIQNNFLISVLEGNNQHASRNGNEVNGGVATFTPLRVKVTFENGSPAPGIKVTFTVTQYPRNMAVQIVPSSGSAKSDVKFSDRNGVASLDFWGRDYSIRAYYDKGPFAIEASTEKPQQKVVFNLTVDQ